MSLTIELPIDVERELRREAARTGQAPEELIQAMVTQRFLQPADRAQQVTALLDQWDSEDSEHPDPSPILRPSRTSLQVPDIG